MQEFNQPIADDLKVEVIVRRLTPHILARDEVAIGRLIREATERYGDDLMADAWSELTTAHPWLVETALSAMSPAMKHEFYASGFDVMAETLANAGLKVEDHLRVSDKGFALSREAVAMFAAMNYPKIAEFGEGNETLEGFGLNRSPYRHPLAESSPSNPDYINIWGAVTLFINAAMGWFPDLPSTDEAMEALKDAVTAAAPNVSFEILVSRARYDDRMLAKLASLAHEGLNGRFDKAFRR
jgi:hypothetical protein